MKYSKIKYCDVANGPGVRTTLFVSGCRHHCRGCFNPETWDFNYGKEFDLNVSKELLENSGMDYVTGLTLLGGEPMEPENQETLLDLLFLWNSYYPDKPIWCYTGCTFESLMDHNNKYHTKHTGTLLSFIDVLVDGPFKEELKDISLRFKGSANQRIIDVQKSLRSQRVILWKDDPYYLPNKTIKYE